ncbi:hypothetical protein [Rhodoblastus sp.]|uniref:hypothetical protein n=1 Tax=Rhodoblastus sp. TaxID=1962975 RepID=UPI003F9D9020
MNELMIVPQPRPQPRIELEAEKREDFAPSKPAASPWWKSLAAPVALALVFGIGWAVSARVGDTSRDPSPEMVAAQNAAKEALGATQAQRQEIAALRGNVDSLKSKLEAQAQKTHAAETTIAALQKSLSEQRADAAAATSQLQAKIEKIQSQAEKPADRNPVSTIARPLPRPSPNSLTRTVAAPAPLTPYRAFVLRDIEDGRAVVEGARGLEEVGPGDVLPGGARVERIEKRGANWVVLTDRGAINPDGRWD